MEAPPKPRGRLKLFLGYVAGVGKTYRMLEEAQQLKQQGTDIVIGYFETHNRKDTMAKAEGLELVPRRPITYRGKGFEEMDTPAILSRRPPICVVDELAHTNVPGAERAKRWEDVLVLLDAGIDVFATMNIQHLESLNDQIRHIAGVAVRETVPDWVLKEASEVVMVDATPDAVLNRLKRGVVYEPEKAARALENFFKASTLAALRELALRQTAHEVELRHEKVEAAPEAPALQDIARSYVSDEIRPADKILIHITKEPSTAMLIRRGRRVADYLRGECFALYVNPRSDMSELPMEERGTVERHLNFARNLHIETHVVHGENTAQAIVEFARRHQVTQIFLLRKQDQPWIKLFHRKLVPEIVRQAKDMRVTVLAGPERRSA